MPTETILKVCAHCGSENVTHDALARWDTETQEWSISSTLDNSDCDRCGNECTVEDVLMDYDPWAHARPLDRVRVRYDADAKVYRVYHYPPNTKTGEAIELEQFGIMQNADQAANDFAGQFDDCLVQLDGEDYP
jgi:hypothetical protein